VAHSTDKQEEKMAEYGDEELQKMQNITMLIYLLLLVAPLLWFTGLVGVIIAYVYRDDAPDWLQSHYQLQIRTFWISMLFFFISVILVVFLIGKLLLLLLAIWYLVRLIKGIKCLNRAQPYPTPTSWGF
jgi:uncharacterized membrane protein